MKYAYTEWFKKFIDWTISRELANSLAPNDYRVTASKASA